ncbi:MAG: Lrp/AsnC family transcriptional regulator [Reyranellaceae bacterium]
MNDAAGHATKITSTDMEIIRCLHDDARMSIVQIAKQIKVPESTVRSRLARLTDNGILNFMAVTDPFKLGYRLWVMITIQTELTQIQHVAQSLSALPEVYFVAVVTGDYDMVVSASFRSNEEFLDFISAKLSRIPGITRTANYSLLKIYKREMNVLPPPLLPAAEASLARDSAPRARNPRGKSPPEAAEAKGKRGKPRKK